MQRSAERHVLRCGGGCNAAMLESAAQWEHVGFARLSMGSCLLRVYQSEEEARNVPRKTRPA